jgi:hypothetical protein
LRIDADGNLTLAPNTVSGIPSLINCVKKEQTL